MASAGVARRGDGIEPRRAAGAEPRRTGTGFGFGVAPAPRRVGDGADAVRRADGDAPCADAAAGRSRQPPCAVGPNPSGGGDGAAWGAGDLGLDLGGASAATATAATTAALPAALAAAAAFAATVTALECAAGSGGKGEHGGSSAWCSGPTNCMRRHTGNSCAVSACLRCS